MNPSEYQIGGVDEPPRNRRLFGLHVPLVLHRLATSAGGAGVVGDLEVVTRHHPYLLYPNVPVEGIDLRASLAQRYGQSPERLFGPVEAAGRQAGMLKCESVSHIPLYPVEPPKC